MYNGSVSCLFLAGRTLLVLLAVPELLDAPELDEEL
jgi:hypothetical protein